MKRVMVALLLLLGACSAAQGSDGFDASRRAACEHWANVARDAADGQLTDSEIRDKLAEVISTAGGAEDVGSAARELRGAVTTGAPLSGPIERLNAACA